MNNNNLTSLITFNIIKTINMNKFKINKMINSKANRIKLQ